MKSKQIFILLFLIICVKQISAQQEFFREKNGLTLSGSSNFISFYGGDVDYLFNKNIILSGSYSNSNTNFLDGMYGLSLNYFITDHTIDSPTKGIVGLSLNGPFDDPFDDSILSANFGLLHVFLHKTYFPFSLALLTNFSFHDGLRFQPAIGYSQAFVSNKKVYPVVSVTYVIPKSDSYNQIEYSLFFNVGINIRL